MVKRSVRITVDRSKSADYRTVAENFYNGADIAREFEYWNASGVLIIHAAIAFTDAIAIKLGGARSKGENHHEAIALINELVPASHEKKQALNLLSKIIDQKNLVSYSGEIYTKNDIDKLWKWVVRYKEWAIKILGI